MPFVQDVLVDTSVWVEHFRQNKTELADLMMQDRVLIHPFVLTELACTPPPGAPRKNAGRFSSDTYLSFCQSDRGQELD